ncbi:hypothetical protein H310_05625 [Aphanomyces invadans]|uniref:SAM domain-containing protein n=1 Tax=Aphanomyces invadans TaxID=157072 RepID=A0A024UBE5_9STRA|nr:hypothetical protein H310_05625 [Aphanomyces invadans]ETW03222.1 hypothetical protein H310_05625 [Aphanomyces invadans]|eukprot:XP_008868606.1 hypothetical protein H310_05625 [Aphanomyces invadans]
MKKANDTMLQARPSEPAAIVPSVAAANSSVSSNPSIADTTADVSGLPSLTSSFTDKNTSASLQAPGMSTAHLSASREAPSSSVKNAYAETEPTDTSKPAVTTSKPNENPPPSSTSSIGGYGMQPRLHVPSSMATVSAAIRDYVAEIEPESIAEDLSLHRRIHHAVAHPSLDSHVLLLPSTSLSTVNSLLDDAFKHLTALTPAEDITLKDKYHDIWADIEADRAKHHRDLLTRHMHAWAATAKGRHAAGRLGQHGHQRRVVRCFHAWRRRSAQRRRAAVKCSLAMRAFQARAFHAWIALHIRLKLVIRKHGDARQRRFKCIFMAWRTHVSRRRAVQRMADRQNRTTIEAWFHEWKAAAAVRGQQRRSIHRLGRTMASAQVAHCFFQWTKQVTLMQVADALRTRRDQRTQDVQRTVLQRWRRRARLVVVAGHRFDTCQRRQLAECFRDWKDRWHQYRTIKPATWTCETVGLWLGAVFQLPLDAARACQVSGHELMSLPSRLAQSPLHARDPVLERLLPTLPLFFCSADHCLQLVDAIASLSKTNATRVSKDIQMQHRLAKLERVTDFLSLRHWCAQDRELIAYVRQLDALGMHSFLQLDGEDLVAALKCHRPEHVSLLVAGQQRLRSIQATHPKLVTSPGDPIDDSASFSLASWLDSMHLSQYEPAFRRHDITSVAQLSRLTHDILRHTLRIQSKLHRDRILEFAADVAASHNQHHRVRQAPAFRLKLALSHVDQPPPRSNHSHTGTASPKMAMTSASLAKQVRTLFFSICRWLEGQSPPHHATLDRLYAAMQAASHGHITKASFAHGLRALNAGFTSAHVHAMWETIPKAKTDGRVGYEAFVRFFIGIFEQRRAMLQLAIQSLGGGRREGHHGESSQDGGQLSQLLHALARSDDILARAGVIVAS